MSFAWASKCMFWCAQAARVGRREGREGGAGLGLTSSSPPGPTLGPGPALHIRWGKRCPRAYGGHSRASQVGGAVGDSHARVGEAGGAEFTRLG